MKNKILLILFLLMTSATLSAQNTTIAKLKFEEAEEAFVAKDYATALLKLDEAEKQFGKTNPPIMYLKIMAEFEMVNSDLLLDFNTLQLLRKNCTFYLTNYDKITSIEDKYREVYKISEKIKSLPTTKQQFEDQKKQIELEKKKKQEEEANRINQYNDYFAKYEFFKSYQLGLTVEETIKLYPEFKKHYVHNNETPEEYDYAISAKTGGKLGDIIGLLIKNNKVIGYYGFSFSEDDSKFTNGLKKITDMVNTQTVEFNFNPIEKTIDKSRPDWPGQETAYSWIRNNKTIQFRHLKQSNKGSNYSIISIYTYNLNLAK